jgi:hypothetical protein
MPPDAPSIDPPIDLCAGCFNLGTGPRCAGPDGQRDHHALAAAYLRSAGKSVDAIPHKDAFECVFAMACDRPEDALAFVFAALEQAETAKQEAYLAAGALETLLKRHGPSVIDRVQAAARRDPKLTRCLSGVWGYSGMDKSVRAAIDAVLGVRKTSDGPPRKNDKRMKRR